MKNDRNWFSRLEVVFSICALVVVLAAIVPNICPLAPAESPRAQYSIFPHGGDFSLRMNEIECLKQRVNPYDVWIEKVKLPPYLPWTGKIDETYHEFMNAYTPWEYVYAFPLALFSHDVAWEIYLGIMLLCVAFMGWCAFGMGKCLADRTIDGCFAAAFSIGALAYPLFSNFLNGNYDLLVMTILCLMAWCLNKEHDILAGCCWAVAMTKPQIAILFAIPLLWRRKFLVCSVAAAICVGLTCIVGWWCHTAPIDLILQGPAASAFCFFGSGTMPYFLVLSGVLPPGGLIAIGCILGALICCYQTWLLRKQSNWFFFFLPAFVCSSAWTYSWDFSQLMVWPFFALIAVLLVKNPHSVIVWVFAVLSVLFFSRAYCGYNFVVMWCGGILHFLVYSVELHRTLASLNSTMVLIIATVFFAWFARKDRLGQNGQIFGQRLSRNR